VQRNFAVRHILHSCEEGGNKYLTQAAIITRSIMVEFKVVIQCCTLYTLLLLLPGVIPQFTKKTLSWSNEDLLPLSDKCFCKLEGQIDDCSCKVDTVDDFNNKRIFPRLKSLMAKDYFRYFQYQPNKKCPFWDSTSGKCASNYCQVKNCATTDLPPGISGEIVETGYTQVVENKYTPEAKKKVRTDSTCDGDDTDVEDTVDGTISEKVTNDLMNWKRHDEAVNMFCELETEACAECVHVDLTKNPERYTGYSGEASRRVWKTIYEENCFSPKGATSTKSTFSAAFGSETIQNMCLEKRVFFRVVSGLHTSITIHLTANYPLKTEPSTPFLKSSDTWGPNLELFHQRFDPESTNSQGPYWLKNLYFVYLLELRALAKAAPYLTQQTFFTGREQEDKETVIAVKELLSLVQSFPDHFDETSMFTGGKQAEELKIEFQEHFKNITRVIDCVGCDKCKLWGKLQVTGLGTALKILFSGEFDKPAIAGLPRVKEDLKLSRNEIVALFNAFGKISTSIVELERFREMLRIR